MLRTLLALLATVGTTTAALGQLPAFPGAEGFGALATGGRGGDVYIVTNLNDSGPGSFRDAVSQSNRTVVFEVGGTIDLDPSGDRLAFANNISVFGQTAPGGIAIFGNGISLSHRNNIIVQHMTFRQGINAGSRHKTVNITDGHNMILDHVSMSWGRHDTLGITSNSTDITVQNSILSEAIDPQRFGALIDSSRGITIAHNLWANNQSRNPKGKADMQYINNVVYNWGSHGYVGGHSSAPWMQDIINNYFIEGPNTSANRILTQMTHNDVIYHTGNLVDVNRNGILDGRPVVDSDFRGNSAGDAPTFVPAAQNFPTIPVTIYSADEAFDRVMAQAGNYRYRDSADWRVINHALSFGTQGAIIQNEGQVGGPPWIVGGTPPVDTSRDGIPDEWASAKGLDPSQRYHNVLAPNGYTWLENYVHSLVLGEFDPPPPPPPTEPWSISTAFGRGADAQVTENDGLSGGNGLGSAMNARWTGPSGDRNEYILLRFDLAETDPGAIHAATLEVTAFRDMQSFNHRVYGLNPDALGQLWDEATIQFDGAPALVFDGNSGTRGLDHDQVTVLGDFSTGGFSEGQTISFSHPNLTEFLNLAAAEDVGGEGGVATLLIERITDNTGQSRLATKEATHLESSAPGSVAPGTYAPLLSLQLLLPDIPPLLPGDFNGDGVVDAADYSVWRDGLGVDYDEEHYHDWKTHFGTEQASAAGSLHSPAVPEPASGILVVAAAVALAATCRARRTIHSC